MSRGYGYRPRASVSRSRAVADGPRANKYAGPCALCGAEVPAGDGLLQRDGAGGWRVMHRPTVWHGSPVSGRYVGGCPGEADGLNERGGFGPRVGGDA